MEGMREGEGEGARRVRGGTEAEGEEGERGEGMKGGTEEGAGGILWERKHERKSETETGREGGQTDGNKAIKRDKKAIKRDKAIKRN